MNATVINIDLVLAGAIVADVASILVTQLSLQRRFILGATGIVGFLLMLLHVPSLAEANVAMLASAGYAIGSCALAIVFLARAQGEGVAKRLQQTVFVMGGTMTFALGAITWIALR